MEKQLKMCSQAGAFNGPSGLMDLLTLLLGGLRALTSHMVELGGLGSLRAGFALGALQYLHRDVGASVSVAAHT